MRGAEDEEAGLARPPPPGYAPRGDRGPDPDPDPDPARAEESGSVTPPPPPAYQVAAQLPSYEEAERTKGERKLKCGLNLGQKLAS